MNKIKTALFYLFIFTSFNSIALTQEEAKNWQLDLITYKRILKEKHINLFHKVAESEFDRKLKAIDSSLTTINKNQLLVSLMRLHNNLGDGHTAIPAWGQNLQRFPFDVIIQNGRVLIIGVSKELQSLLGSELISIDGKPINQIIQAISKIVPFAENKHSKQIRVGHYLLLSEILSGLGVLRTLHSAELVFNKNNQITTVNSLAVSQTQYQTDITYKLDYKKTFSVKNKIIQSKSLWFSPLNNGDTGYIYFEEYPSVNEMTNFGKKISFFMKNNETKNLIIDFRENYGGNFFTGLILAQFIIEIDSLDWQNGIYVLISNKTYSAAMSNSINFKQFLNARLVGQPTGAAPSGYQDAGSFKLPFSQLIIMYSKRMFRFEKGNKYAVKPDIETSLTFDDYLEGHDSAISWVLNDIKSH